MKKIAIIGATGYIGRSLVPEFLADVRKCELFLFSRSPKQAQIQLGVQGKEHVHVCAVREFSSHTYDVVINCTGIGSTKELANNPSAIFKVTEDIDTMIISYLENNQSTLYINMSSGAVYGNSFQEPAIRTTMSTLHVNDMPNSEYYAVAKVNAEAKHRAYRELGIVDIRVFAFFSRFVDQTSPFLMSDIARCIQDRTILETTQEDIIRDYICPQDMYELIRCIIKKGKSNDVYDIYSKKPVSKFELLTFLQKKYGLRFTIKKSMKGGVGLPKKAYYSKNKKAKNIGYIPSCSSLRGIDLELCKLLARNNKKLS